MIDFEKLLDAVPENISVIGLGPDYKLLYANKAHLKSVGLTREKLIGRPMFEVFPDVSGSLEFVKSCLNEVIETKESCKPPVIQYDIPAAEEGKFETRYWNLEYTPLLSDKGEVTCIVQHSLDVTKLVELGFPF